MAVKVTPSLPPTLGLTQAKDTQLLGLGRLRVRGPGPGVGREGVADCLILRAQLRVLSPSQGPDPADTPQAGPPFRKPPPALEACFGPKILSSLKPTRAPKAPVPGSFPPPSQILPGRFP